MRYTQLRDLHRVTMQTALTYSCMNLKKLAVWKGRKGLLSFVFQRFFVLFAPIRKKAVPV